MTTLSKAESKPESKAEKVENGLFIFRRDLRIVDNKGLLEASRKCANVFTVFIFTPEQVTSANKFKSDNAVQFMIESLPFLKKADTYTHFTAKMTPL